ncbi:hypothetical protein SARC_01414 [Sphaeroforma arctica JP610]|uniref:Uncharacterized protein n=1 Tax=Sphaeroforma arctica JP610 TaxID=667725 RepID=A0A0L0GDW1_9EUKA|nr:hypothetical protein SARC_01414 [Sphaeroforma arctica JP610]KNC86458.1 hypothetical protein SARC_01414 [Sphaeroforma arctica JP610]|eukprot:XP_014160360.1 hypothetical protein SARC_01414 [Sphaeroforma arctica JP610]
MTLATTTTAGTPPDTDSSVFVSTLKKKIGGLVSPIMSRDQFTGDPCLGAIQTARRALKDNGVLIIRGCITRAACAAGQVAAYRAWERDVKPSIDVQYAPKVDVAKTIYDVQSQHKFLWPTGVIGNKGFGFMYAQPEAKSDYHAAQLDTSDAQPTVFAPGSGFQANLAVMEHPDSELATAILFQVTGNMGGMVSQDSFKTFRGNLTVPHVDDYPTSDTFNRVQAMVIGYREGNVRLVFGRATHQPDISVMYRDKTTTGFTSLSNSDSIVQVLEAAGAIVIPEPGDIVCWTAGVVHFEMNIDPKGNKFKPTRGHVQERYVVGTHNPSGSLTQTQLETLTGMAESGFILHPYVGPKRQFGPANANNFHRKNTQYCRRRVQPPDEKARFVAATKDCKARVHKLTDRRRQLYGIPIKDANRLFKDPLAQQVYNTKVQL